MNWLTSMDKSERDEIEADLIASFQMGVLTENEFRKQMGKMGKNATDIQEFVDYYSPPPAENGG